MTNSMIDEVRPKEHEGQTKLLDIKGLCKYFDISEKTAYILVK